MSEYKKDDPGKCSGGEEAHRVFREVAKMNMPNKAQTPAKCATFKGVRTGSVYGGKKR